MEYKHTDGSHLKEFSDAATSQQPEESHLQIQTTPPCELGSTCSLQATESSERKFEFNCTSTVVLCLAFFSVKSVLSSLFNGIISELFLSGFTRNSVI
jgi:hypothetical protein